MLRVRTYRGLLILASWHLGLAVGRHHQEKLLLVSLVPGTSWLPTWWPALSLSWVFHGIAIGLQEAASYRRCCDQEGESLLIHSGAVQGSFHCRLHTCKSLQTTQAQRGVDLGLMGAWQHLFAKEFWAGKGCWYKFVKCSWAEWSTPFCSHRNLKGK